MCEVSCIVDRQLSRSRGNVSGVRADLDRAVDEEILVIEKKDARHEAIHEIGRDVKHQEKHRKAGEPTQRHGELLPWPDPKDNRCHRRRSCCRTQRLVQESAEDPPRRRRRRGTTPTLVRFAGADHPPYKGVWVWRHGAAIGRSFEWSGRHSSDWGRLVPSRFRTGAVWVRSTYGESCRGADQCSELVKSC